MVSTEINIEVNILWGSNESTHAVGVCSKSHCYKVMDVDR